MSEEAAQPAPEGPGGRLRAARKAMNVEIREVADALNLPATSIEALEGNDFAELPNLVFARGYVRAYAKLVELDPDPVVAAFQAAAMPQEEVTPVVTQTVSTEPVGIGPKLKQLRFRFERFAQNQPQVFLGLLAGVGLLLVLLLWLAFSDDDPVAERPAVSELQTQNPAVLAGPGFGTEGQSGGSASGAPAGRPAGRDGRELAEPLLAEVTPAGETDAPVPAQAAGPAGLETGLANTVAISSGDDRLRFSFVSDCWVEVRDAGGALLYGNLGKAGALLELTGAGPFRILLGYAPGASLAFNGESVPLSPHTRNDVARLVLGQ